MTTTDKSPDAFRTISEVAEDLDLPQHVLRFWETRFSQIKPLKRGGGRRYYRPDDVELLRGIRHLLYGEGYTIKGAQRILKEQGVRFVMQVWKEDGLPVPVIAREAEPVSDADPTADAENDMEPLPRGVLPDREPDNAAPQKYSGFRFIDRLRGEKEPEADFKGPQKLSKDEVRRLQSTLFELLECKRILDQVR
ncbi:MerR family transcriptional regulator [Roseibium aquae]|uniref:MerR family transcriptional regulator n=1 Tax=Roseibium aquae TaxID=1323746 RepID=A0A916X1I5_9HYPH|nr:MerR family transcriptional regulator [Roseibium aquae]GGB56685.1 MerR family transcriptional regulator [Roseibium aquae]